VDRGIFYLRDGEKEKQYKIDSNMIKMNCKTINIAKICIKTQKNTLKCLTIYFVLHIISFNMKYASF